jgi:hypothetical protein
MILPVAASRAGPSGKHFLQNGGCGLTFAGGVVNCPADDGSAEVLALAYPGRPGVDLWISLNGCGGVSNGYIDAGGT